MWYVGAYGLNLLPPSWASDHSDSDVWFLRLEQEELDKLSCGPVVWFAGLWMSSSVSLALNFSANSTLHNIYSPFRGLPSPFVKFKCPMLSEWATNYRLSDLTATCGDGGGDTPGECLYYVKVHQYSIYKASVQASVFFHNPWLLAFVSWLNPLWLNVCNSAPQTPQTECLKLHKTLSDTMHQCFTKLLYLQIHPTAFTLS